MQQLGDLEQLKDVKQLRTLSREKKEKKNKTKQNLGEVKHLGDLNNNSGDEMTLSKIGRPLIHPDIFYKTNDFGVTNRRF